MTLTIAHLSDVHLPSAVGLPLRHARLKRGLGLLNWHLRRRRIHRPETIAALLADLDRQHVDHIAVTGDLVNLGLPDEHAIALDWLRALGPPDRVSVVPGNHDIYVRLARDPGTDRWRPYMQSDAFGRTLTAAWDGFPTVRKVGPAALVGLNSAVPTPPFVAAGHLGDGQLERLAQLLAVLRAAALVRIVLIHHPPLPGQAAPRRSLADADRLARVLADHGAEVVLHGHNHTDTLVHAGRAVVLGVPSFSAAARHGDEPLARYNLLHLGGSPSAPSLEVVGRGLAEPGGPVVELARRRLDVAPAEPV
jgi:3',5'-cyclic AMP phosphodiesterase CpdA